MNPPVLSDDIVRQSSVWVWLTLSHDGPSTSSWCLSGGTPILHRYSCLVGSTKEKSSTKHMKYLPSISRKLQPQNSVLTVQRTGEASPFLQNQRT